MNLLPKIYRLKDEATNQLYEWFSKEVRSLPKTPDGHIDPMGEGLVDNDVDAMRHAFVPGVYVLEFSEQTSKIMGRLNELGNFDYSTSAVGAENMDMWNNAVGRKVAKKSKNWRELYENLLREAKNGGLIINPYDKRKYKGEKRIKRMPKSFVISIKENRTGSNIEFLDVHRGIVLSKAEFIEAIRLGKYPGYSIKKHNSGEFPYSTRDRYSFNNLG